MNFHKCGNRTAAFTLVELVTGAGIFSLFMGGLIITWMALQVSAVNMTSYAKRQNDQMRVVDYLKRDIRRGSNVEIYNGATLVTGTNSGTELRVTLPDYYADSREEDNVMGTRVPNTPTLTGESVTYGAPITVRYYSSNGGVIRNEAGATRTVAESTGAFSLSFRREASGDIRCRVISDQPTRGPSARIVHRAIDTLCSQRTQLQIE